MSRVITFSRVFPKGHPKEGQPTFFSEKIMASFADILPDYKIPDSFTLWDWHEYYNAIPKYHTIRSGTRWKVGDKFSPRVWSEKPYASKQIQFAPDIEIKKVWLFKIHMEADGMKFTVGENTFPIELGQNTYHPTILEIAKNDGLNIDDFLSWFKYPNFFYGQIICWNGKIQY